jgi:periplasmic divalent cation tolerance protein
MTEPGSDGPSALQVQTTVDSEADAEAIATALVEERLAACVQVVGPIRSTYRWRGAVERATEWLVLVKTTRAAYPALEARLRSVHRYEEPEIVALPIVAGSAGYLGWIEESVAGRGAA